MLINVAQEIEEFNAAIAALSEEDQAMLDDLTQEIKAEIIESSARYPFAIIFAAYSKSLLWLAELAETNDNE